MVVQLSLNFFDFALSDPRVHVLAVGQKVKIYYNFKKIYFLILLLEKHFGRLFVSYHSTFNFDLLVMK